MHGLYIIVDAPVDMPTANVRWCLLCETIAADLPDGWTSVSIEGPVRHD